MRFLDSNKALTRELLRCQTRYKHWLWAVAWATIGFKSWDYALQHRRKIRKLAIGTHFYQTHPDVLDEFADDSRVRFVLRPDGIFHPKIYLFEDGPHGWACICGSANFTRGAVSKNLEASIYLDSRDDPEDLHERLAGFVSAAWRTGTVPTAPQRKYYREQWQLKRDRLAELSGRFVKGSAAKKPDDSEEGNEGRDLHQIPLVRMSWHDFVTAVKRERSGKALAPRLEVLEAARQAFIATPGFSDLDPQQRKRIAGFGHRRDDPIDWMWFGNMQSAGRFARLVNQRPKSIARALDSIPLEGEVRRSHYEAFVDAIKGLPGVAMGSATRLLSMKRPDVFVSFNARSRERLCQACGLPQNVDWDGYWDLILARIRESIWYQHPQPSHPQAHRIWANRVALLDALYYRPLA